MGLKYLTNVFISLPKFMTLESNNKTIDVEGDRRKLNILWNSIFVGRVYKIESGFL